jgi:hypothetical protein
VKAGTVVAVEVGMVAGILAAAFIVPRSTPLLTFALISTTAFVLGNVLLLRQTKKVQEAGGIGPRRNRNLNLIIGLFVVYWVVCYLLRKH